jgi:O-antigen/teichoic acid export membrane protein
VLVECVGRSLDLRAKSLRVRPGFFPRIRLKISTTTGDKTRYLRDSRMSSVSQPEIAKQSVRGSMILFLGSLLSTIVLFVSGILITRLLGPDQYGSYTLAFVIPGIFQVVAGLGVNISVTRYAAYSLAQGHPEEARHFTVSAILFMAGMGVALTILNYVAAGYLVGPLLGRPDLSGLTREASVLLLGQSLVLISTSAAIGWNSNGVASLTNLAQSIIKLIGSIVLILLGLGAAGAVLAQVSSYLIGGVFGVVLLYAIRLHGSKPLLRTLATDVKQMTKYGFPAFLGSTIGGLAALYFTVILARIASNAVVGYYQGASNFITPLSILSSSMGLTLFRAFAHIQGTKADLTLAFRQAAKYVGFVSAPIIFIVSAAAYPLIDLVYGASYLPGVPYLQGLSLSYVTLILGGGVIANYFNGVGRTRLSLATGIVGSLVLVFVAPALAIYAGLGVYGLILSLLTSNIATTVVGLRLCRNRLNTSIDAKSSFVFIGCGAIAYVVSILVNFLGISIALELLADVGSFMATYLTLVPLFGGLNNEDIDELDEATRLPILSYFTALIFRYERYILRLISTHSSVNDSI